jgi:hypothetical protein
MAVISNCNETVGIGDLTFKLVQGQPLPDGLPQDVVDTLIASGQASDNEVPTVDIYSQEYRDARAAEAVSDPATWTPEVTPSE